MIALLPAVTEPLNYVNDGTISNSYAKGSVAGDRNIGGLVGVNNGTIGKSYAVGKVEAEQNPGGLVGSGDSGTTASSYWDEENSGRKSSAGGEGKTNQEMKQQATFVNWDFAGIWAIDENESYPYLKWEVE